MGTAAYMSPEQARGQPVDKRTDVWAFACVLYEMLTGRRAFAGATVSDTIAAILEREPDWTALPSDTPDVVKRLLRRSLVKQPKQRPRDIGDARLELEELANSLPSPAAPPVARRGRLNRWIAGVLVALPPARWVISPPNGDNRPTSSQRRPISPSTCRSRRRSSIAAAAIT